MPVFKNYKIIKKCSKINRKETKITFTDQSEMNVVFINAGQSRSAMLNHAYLLAKFFLFSVALITADIVSDIITAEEFFRRKDFYWGVFTLVPIFMPFVASCINALINLCQCINLTYSIARSSSLRRMPTGFHLNQAKFSRWKNDLPCVFWDFPMLQPVR